MKNLIISISVGLISGFTVYILLDYLFERPSKSVSWKSGGDQELDDIEHPEVVYEDDDVDNTVPLKPANVGK